MSWLKRVKLVYERIEAALAVFAAILLMVIMLVVIIDVLGRNSFNKPLMGATEICADSLVWITFLAAAWILKKDGHVWVNLVTDRIKIDVRFLVFMFNSIVGVIVCLGIAFYGVMVVQSLAQRKVTEIYVLALPLAPLYAIIPIGCTFLMIRFAMRSYDFFLEWKRHQMGKGIL